MDREKILTIALGLLIGFLAAGGYFAVNKFLFAPPKKGEIITPVNPQTLAAQTASPSAVLFNVDKPEDNSSVTASPIVISGKAAPKSQIIIFANADEKIATGDAAGNFTSQIKLEEGENEISFTVIDSDGNKTVARRKISLEIEP